MSDNEPREAIARAILDNVLDRLCQQGEPSKVLHDVLETDSGEPVPRYGATSEEGYGSFLCEYMPVKAVEKIVEECERIFDKATAAVYLKDEARHIQVHLADRLNTASVRSKIIAQMAWVATYNLILRMRERLCNVLQESLEDSLITGETALYSLVNKHVLNAGATNAKIDPRIDIAKLARESGIRRRTNLARTLSFLPYVQVPTGKGRPAKWDKHKLEQIVLRTTTAFKKRKYRAPTLKEVALEISKRQPLTEASLKMLLKRYGLSWRAIKKVT